MRYLLITVRWLDDRYHGKVGRQGPAEWPPSPYRLFQAIMAAVARNDGLNGELGHSLQWLQSLAPPLIFAPRSCPANEFTRYVPNNDGDRRKNRQDRLADKLVCPTLMLDEPEIHYLWKIETADIHVAESVCKGAQLLTCLGWGVDMAFATGKIIEDINDKRTVAIHGIRWMPRPGVVRDEGMLRTPTVKSRGGDGSCSLSNLRQVYQSAQDRVEHGKPLNTVKKPTVFDTVFYESEERILGRPIAVFALRESNGEYCRYSQRRLMHLAGMLRHLAITSMAPETGCPPSQISDVPEWLDRYVAGHAPKGSHSHRQFSYVPLPSIGMAHTDPAVRRVMVVAPSGDDRWLEHLALRLAGQQLKPKVGNEFNGPPPTLIRSRSDKVVRYYTQPANTWASVTPVILPGHDDHKPAKTVRLIEKALRQSGVEQPCEFEWQATSWWPQSLSAHKYDRNKRPTGYYRPKHLQSQTAVHLKLKFKDNLQVPGPLTIGAGRHCGFGLMAGVQD